LIELGAEVLEHRLAVWAGVSGLAREAYSTLGSPGVLAVAYQSATFGTAPVTGPVVRPDRAEAARLLTLAFEERRRDEIARGVTLVGPHRDDLALSLDGSAARVFASQGQQRTVALALRLAEIDYVRRETGEEPLLLLDDVFSELDPLRRTALVALIGKQSSDRRQTFLAVTDTAGVPGPAFQPAAVFTVGGGEIHRGG
jgi:DNA replication and repair protein RecF